MWVETIAFHSKILVQVPFAGYFILYRWLSKLLFSMKTLKWWIICLISYLGSFKICFPNLHVLCLFPWFFFISCVGCFTNIWEIEAKILIFQKIITTCRISVSKMIPAGFSEAHFFSTFLFRTKHTADLWVFWQQSIELDILPTKKVTELELFLKSCFTCSLLTLLLTSVSLILVIFFWG